MAEQGSPNRTTVGLKDAIMQLALGDAVGGSQSHHSGIESGPTGFRQGCSTAVPIAPQWD